MKKDKKYPQNYVRFIEMPYICTRKTALVA